MVTISIIMPLFNAEKYLPEALNSVLGQTYKEFELICIDDGSTDSTRKILRDFQKRDDRIKIFANKQRLGAGPTRNKGIEKAQGKYILFLDGDDVFEEELLEKAHRTMEEMELDIVVFEYMRVPSEVIYTKRIRERPRSFIDNYCNVPFSVEDFSPREFPNRSNSPCDKMFRKSFLVENRLEFQALPAFNDVYFAKMAFFCAKRIIYLNDCRIMVYARDHSQPSRISNDRNPMFGYYAMERLAVELKERGMFSEFAEYYYYTFSLTIGDILINEEKNKKRQEAFYNFLKNEGIAKCIQYGGDYYSKADSYDQDFLESFQSKKFSQWFYVLDTYFQFYLKRNEKIVYEFVYNKLQENKKIVIWGMGRNGKILLEYLRKYSLEIFAIVDSDENKQGNVVDGYTILKPCDIYAKADMILVTSKQVLWEIRCETKGIEVIDVLGLLKDKGDKV